MKKKLLIALGMVLCAALLVVGSIAGTFAYLTSRTDKVTNTFTIGKVKITLDEAVVDENGEAIGGRTEEGNDNYKLMPGHTYIKDPTIHVDASSEDCWLFVQIIDNIAGAQDEDTIATQLAANGWTLVTGTTNVYAYKEIATATTKDYVVFETITVKGDLTNAELEAFADETIEITAYAIQADGFDTAAEAWAAAPATWN